jgi:hypothetical protein
MKMDDLLTQVQNKNVTPVEPASTAKNQSTEDAAPAEKPKSHPHSTLKWY